MSVLPSRADPGAITPGLIQQYFEAQAFNSFLAGWSGRPDVGLTYSRLFSKDTYQNPAKVEIPGLDAVLAEAIATEDLDERAAKYAEANEDPHRATHTPNHM